MPFDSGDLLCLYAFYLQLSIPEAITRTIEITSIINVIIDVIIDIRDVLKHYSNSP